MADSGPSDAEQAPVVGKRKCSPEQLERLAKAREKALEKRAALAGLRQKEKELADLALKERFRRAEQLEREYKDREVPPAAPAVSKKGTRHPKQHKHKHKQPPPPPSCSSSETEEDSEEEEEEYEPPPRKASSRAPRRHRADAPSREDDWMKLARRVFPGL
jgi:hypothetical protein